MRPGSSSPPRCLYCGDLLDVSKHGRKTCEDSHRSKVSRARPRITPVVRVLARLMEGADPDYSIPYMGLILRIWQSERVRARNEVKRNRLPGGKNVQK